ncbi:MAG TPA: VanZ family protein [Puia sp.]|nr:VanZ family protein [Puia sp.]
MVIFLRKYFAALYVPITWTIIIGILMTLPGSALPNEQAFRIPQFDKIVHMALFGGFVFLWDLRLSKRSQDMRRLFRWFFAFYVLANVYGIGMEYVQKYWIPGRDFDLADIIADMIGAGLGYGFSHLLLLPTEKNKNG